ncbi:MAG: GerMN domain-containing protein [Clostridioides sp.]|jgi:hypothetical protein|nr:GerMN domain-containing protein [Clostridioides sp.]
MSSKNKILLFSILMSVSLFTIGCEENTTDETHENENQNIEQRSDSNNEDVQAEEPTIKEDAVKQDIKTQEIVVYSYDLDNEELVENKVNVVAITPENLYNELINLKVIPESTFNSFKVQTVKIDEKENQIGYLDIGSDFMETKYGSSAESCMLDALAKTFKENLKLDKLKLTVDGKNYESGHIILEDSDYL